MIVLFGRARDDLHRQWEVLCGQGVTYAEVGQTAAASMPPGYHHVTARRRVGRGTVGWERACDALSDWAPQRGAGLVVYPSDAAVAGGATVLFSRSLGGLSLIIPCRVVYVTEEERRFGFAYGTLPGHPEAGEESFHVVLSADGDVLFEISAFSRPGDWLTKLGDPVARLVQSAVTRSYLSAMERAARAVSASA